MALCLLIGGLFPDVLHNHVHSLNFHVLANYGEWCILNISGSFVVVSCTVLVWACSVAQHVKTLYKARSGEACAETQKQFSVSSGAMCPNAVVHADRRVTARPH